MPGDRSRGRRGNVKERSGGKIEAIKAIQIGLDRVQLTLEPGPGAGHCRNAENSLYCLFFETALHLKFGEHLHFWPQ